MACQIEFVSHGEVSQSFKVRIQTWTYEVLDRVDQSRLPPSMFTHIWSNMEELAAFYRQEKEALGVVTGEDVDFLATHEAWRGHPRIHICEEKVRDVPLAAVQGAMHHEIAHALNHGAKEFYTFRFSKTLQETGNLCGMDLPLLQHFVYFLSIAIKDDDVVTWLTQIGLESSQLALIEYLMFDTEEEHQAWKVASNSPALRKITTAAFLKMLITVEKIISLGVEEALGLKEQWNKTYKWLPEKEREHLFRFARDTFRSDRDSFQDRLEKVALDLITDTHL